jgi:hypothetical protein
MAVESPLPLPGTVLARTPHRSPALQQECHGEPDDLCAVASRFLMSRRPGAAVQNPADDNLDLALQPGRSAAVVEGHLVAVGVRERESAAERPVGGR